MDYTSLYSPSPSPPASLTSLKGPVGTAYPLHGCFMYELLLVGPDNLIGEIIGLSSGSATFQLYEESSNITIGAPVTRTHKLLEVEVGPGLLSNIFDGIQRPLSEISRITQSIYIPRGISLDVLCRKTEYTFTALINNGDIITGGSIIGVVDELSYKHKILLPSTLSGEVSALIPNGKYTIEKVLCKVGGVDVKMYSRRAVRHPQKVREKLPVEKKLVTGIRILDTLFPAALGGTVAIPGAFGCGKTVVSQALAKYSNVDIVIYVGCGERGNEMAELLSMNKSNTVLIANTSNMPVAAREASIYTAITIGEYFREQGSDVALMADSTSRWAEALREISGRLAELPADGGFPAYLSGRLAYFYERAGRVLNYNNTIGTLSVIGAVSPPGGDFSDSVTTATLNVVQVFWALDKILAQKKHFPAINVYNSYSKYLKKVSDSNRINIKLVFQLLHSFREINEVVKLVGRTSLSDSNLLLLDCVSLISDEFLQQNNCSLYDACSPIEKTDGMLDIICTYYRLSHSEIESKGMEYKVLKSSTKGIVSKIKRMKFESGYDFLKLKNEMEQWFRVNIT